MGLKQFSLSQAIIFKSYIFRAQPYSEHGGAKTNRRAEFFPFLTTPAKRHPVQSLESTAIAIQKMESSRILLSRIGAGLNFGTMFQPQRILPCLRFAGKPYPRLSALNHSMAMDQGVCTPAVSPLKGPSAAQTLGRSLGYNNLLTEEIGDRPPHLQQRVFEATKEGRPTSRADANVENSVASGVAASASSPGKSSTAQSPAIEFPESSEAVDNAAVDVMVIGSMAVDLTCTVTDSSRSSMLLHTSHPAKSRSSAGGVAHNVALATSYASSSSVRLITALGSDPEGAWLRDYVRNVGLDVKFISGGAETAKHVAIKDKEGELVVATADMRIIEGFKEEEIQREIQRGKPKFVAFDGYISPTSVKAILDQRGTETKGTLPLECISD